MIAGWIPTRDNSWLVMPRYTNPSQEVQILPDKLHVQFAPSGRQCRRLPAFPGPPAIQQQFSIVFVVKTFGDRSLTPVGVLLHRPSKCESQVQGASAGTKHGSRTGADVNSVPVAPDGYALNGAAHSVLPKL